LDLLSVRRARQGSGLVTDLAPSHSNGGKGKGRLPEPIERIIRELLQKRFLTKQKRSLASFHSEVAQACKAQKLRVPMSRPMLAILEKQGAQASTFPKAPSML
jgi:hypothetical protein